jgi:ribosomal protein L37AE/L43A
MTTTGSSGSPTIEYDEMANQTGNHDYSCSMCNKTFNSRSGIWRHNKKYHPSSNKENSIDKNENNCDTDFDLKTMFIQLMKQNKELQNQLFEIAKEKTAITNNTINNNNTMNNKFNLQIFLNETCKDAMNIQEFIDFCKVQHSDFENFGKYGYVESMTRIIMRNLMELEVHRRPIHCTDAKREVLYVKDNNVWVNDFSREKLIRAIKYIAAKNVKQIPDWMDHNPDSKNTQTKLHDKYMRMVCHSMGGRDEAEDQEYYKKIIHNVAKEVVIDKMR